MRRIRVLLADDHEIVRRGLCDVLRGVPDMEVVGEARDGAEAVRMARDLAPDVAVLDISMPGLDGVRAAERMAEECPAVALLALTMHDDRAHLSHMMAAGASGYVLKGSAPDELMRAIRMVAEGLAYVDPQLAGQVLIRRSGRVTVSGSPDVLSDREEEVLRMLAWGHSNKETARELGISTKTVETYRARIHEKLGLRSRTDIVRYALQHGWLSDD